MVQKEARRKIEYECNNCRKTRILFILQSLHKDVDQKGYVEYVDVHQCLEDRLNANILYVDKSLVVRSQVPVRVGDDLSTQQISSLQIPVPKKVDLKETRITPTKEFKHKNLKGLRIADKLRQSQYVLEKKGDGNNIDVESELSFIELEAIVSKNVDENISEDWFKVLISILEAIVLLDEEMLAYMITYLDPKLNTAPTGDSIIEIDMILHAKSSFPVSSLKSYATFRRQWPDFSKDYGKQNFELYEKLLTYCIGNQHKTLLDVYFKAEDSIEFNDFIDRIEDLSMLGLINIQKTEFFTVQED
ncbi:MAG: hypothetical protein KGD64_05700 [Candidatus Heimdallarchaeota archaeon]|nr:hypothetical protein [Candidatus Heimdallarchaeota archaeon]